LGGHFNAYTSNELTVYYITTTTQNAKEAVMCLSDIFINTEYNLDEFNKEKEVVCSEIKMYEDDYPYICQKNMTSNIFSNTPIQHPLAGSIESVGSIDVDKLKSFKIRTYTPGRIVVSTAGGLDIDTVYDMLDENLFSKIEIIDTPRWYAKEQKFTQPKQKLVYEQKDTQQFYCAIAMPGYNVSASSHSVESIVNILLGGCMSSRLFEGVREEKGLVYHISCHGRKFSEYGANYIFFICNKDKASETLSTIRAILDRAKSEGLTQEELDKAKKICINNLVLSREAVSDVAELNFKHYIYHNKMLTLDEMIQEINAIKLEEVNARMIENLDYNKFTFSIVSDTNDLTPQDFFE